MSTNKKNTITDDMRSEINKRKEKLEILIAIRKYEIKLIDKIKEIVSDMDGKVINKKFTDRIEETVLKVNNNTNRIGYANIKYDRSAYSDDTYITISINCWHKEMANVIKGNNKLSKSINLYDSTDIGLCYVNPNEISDITDSGRYRINAEKLNKKFTEKQNNIQNNINKLENNYENIDNMILDVIELKQKAEEFKNNYCYDVVDMFGCNYNLEYRGSYNTKIFCGI